MNYIIPEELVNNIIDFIILKPEFITEGAEKIIYGKLKNLKKIEDEKNGKK